jgi:hypothetical protein
MNCELDQSAPVVVNINDTEATVVNTQTVKSA